MDQRQTFENLDELKIILSSLHASQVVVSLLLDREGLTRMEGIITTIDDRNNSLAATTFTITSSNEDVISFREVIAVNGIFRSEYTEC